ncbi:MAG TPA: response regulator transcription factor [Polyangiaceae bacterium]|nr:response regulator transcription factor [Polyangiaceae bacterium]
MKLLVVEDDAKLARFLARILIESGYAVDTCRTVADTLRQAETGLYDLLVLDWMLPDGDGLSIVRELRERGSTVAILMLTARGETSERVLGLELGADDYMSKPFDPQELVARVHALLRRAGAFQVLKRGELEIDRVHRRVVVGGRPIDLTMKEYALLLHLAHRGDAIVSRSELLAQVWQTKFDTGSNLVEVSVSRLRDKFGEFAWMVETVRGAGYRLRTRKAS